MSDLLKVLGAFDTAPFSHLLPALDRCGITTTDLITVTPQEIAKRAQVPPVEIAKLSQAVVEALRSDIRAQTQDPTFAFGLDSDCCVLPRISTLDDQLDAALDGGLQPGYVTEITGESGVGKTQFLITLLLSVQLPPPRGLGRSAIYISTEAALSTLRLNQLLGDHPELSTAPVETKPSLDRVLSIQTPDIESQEHILRYQVPVAVRSQNVGLVVIDSIAANYRAEFDRSGQLDSPATALKAQNPGQTSKERQVGQSMAERKPQLVQLGAFLRDLARTESVAIVVANQIADRFSAAATFTPSHNPPAGSPFHTPDPLTLDHQQRWFTGWGDLPEHIPGHQHLKTPSLGLVWSNQIAARIAMVQEHQQVVGREKRRRWMRLVFSPWTGATAREGIEYEIKTEGLCAVG